MLISESGLARAMKRAYKTGGYTIIRDGIDTIILADRQGWLAECRTSELPRKVIAAMAEHLGYLPEGQTAVLAKKDMDPQTVIFETAIDAAKSWMAADRTEYATLTDCIYSGYRIYQHEAEGKPIHNYGVPEELLELLEDPTPTVLVCDPLLDSRATYFDDNYEERVVILAMDQGKARQEGQIGEIWQGLEAIVLTSRKRD